MNEIYRQARGLLQQTATEIKLFWRTGEAVLLTFVTPMMGMALFVYLDREGMLARVVLHELDHLNGILFIDRIPEKKRQRILKSYDKNVKV